jgi:hypothetical protein
MSFDNRFVESQTHPSIGGYTTTTSHNNNDNNNNNNTNSNIQSKKYNKITTAFTIATIDEGKTSQKKHVWTCYTLFKVFEKYRLNCDYEKLIEFLVKNFPNNVKNKTFNFTATGHLFHSLYAYVPSVSELIKERKQIRLQADCIGKLFNNTINDFKLYTEMFDFIETLKNNDDDDDNNENNGQIYQCPCQLLNKRLTETKDHINTLNCKKFDSKPPKLKKEAIDNILYKYSLNWKGLLLKKKEKHTGNVKTKAAAATVRKKKTKKKHMLTDKIIYFQNTPNDQIYNINNNNNNKLYTLNGLTLKSCQHNFISVERQTKAGDEIVSFVHYCKLCHVYQ